MSKPIVLFVNHRKAVCGVWQYGRRFADILARSEQFDFEYVEVGSRSEWVGVTSHRGTSAILYNYTDLTFPWLDLGVVRRRSDLLHFAIYHEGPLPWGPTAGPGQPKRLPANAFLLVTDPTHIDTLDAFAIPRPLLGPVEPGLRSYDSPPVIKSFGFGFAQKGFAKLVERVNVDFDEAVIRLHITTSEVCDASGQQSATAIQACQEVQRKPGVKLEVTTCPMTDDDLMAWLAESSLCAFLYEEPPFWRGVSSVIDYALSANTPIAVTRTAMFRHIVGAAPSICVEDRSLREIMASGTAALDGHRACWSRAAFVKCVEQILSSCSASPMQRFGSTRVNCFLKSQGEVDSATAQLGFLGAPANTACPPKNWDLLASLPHVKGRVLDLGSGTDGSFFLKACAKLGLGVERWGIDIAPSPPVEGAQVVVGDLMYTPFRGDYFQTLVCLSVIEHGVDTHEFAAECSRLLTAGGRLVVSFDVWEPKIDTSKLSIYGLPWRILGRRDIEVFVATLAEHGLHLTSPINWAMGGAVIRPGYFSPFHGIAYTFGVFVFEKG